jgi:putative membrane protein
MDQLPQPVLRKNDKKAIVFILLFSAIAFAAISILSKASIQSNPGFDVHIFALINAVINSIVAILLLLALLAVKKRNYMLHKRIMLAALVLSVIFLVSYIAHHLLAGEAVYGDANHDGLLSDAERMAVGGSRSVYLIILLSHIFLAGIMLPFILFTAYRALIAEYPKHKKLARITWPLWLYIAVTGPVIYWMIHPYYR